MTRIEEMFFELVQVALGNRKELSEIPSAEEWDVLYEMVGEQTVVGVLQAGLEKLPSEQRPYLNLLLEWIGTAQIVIAQNEQLDKRCLELIKWLEKAGIKASILKGQGIARYYDDLRMLRMPGDIDVFVDCGRKEAIEKAESVGCGVESWDYKHAHLEIWEDTEVEMHYRVEIMFNLVKNRKLQKWFKEHQDGIFCHTDKTDLTDKGKLVTPTVEFNVFYILLHIYRHFFSEGVGLRQIMDYYFVLKALWELKGVRGINRSAQGVNGHYLEAVKEFGMERFAEGLMWVMQEVMAMPKEWMPWEPDEKEGRYILEQVMEGGDLGHYGDHQKYNTGWLGYAKTLCRHSIHLMGHYPSEAIWGPVWMVWHKVWKLGHGGLAA